MCGGFAWPKCRGAFPLPPAAPAFRFGACSIERADCAPAARQGAVLVAGDGGELPDEIGEDEDERLRCRRGGECPHHHIVDVTARPPHPHDIDLGLRDAPHQMTIPSLRHGRPGGEGGAKAAADRIRHGLDLARERRIAGDRHAEAVAARVLRHPRLAGRRPRAGAGAGILAVRGALALAGRGAPRPVGALLARGAFEACWCIMTGPLVGSRTWRRR